MAEEQAKEYKIMLNATNGFHLIDDSALHLTREQATEKYWGYVNGGENPDDLKIVWQDDPRYPTLEPRPGFIPPPS
tara:strand:- start:797 stop:1024 length:228 start_codon:yes stop_codon:yes gene_type:complete